MVIMKKMNIMKVIKKLSNATYTVAAIALLAMPILSSCEKSETPTNGEEGNIITLSATSELPNTKTSLGESNVVNWTAGDKITTFWGDNTTAAEFTLSTGEGTNSATFAGTPPAGATETCYAIYPHNAATTIDAAKTISFTLPATQTYKAGGFAEGANPMVAYKTAEGKLQFKNLCAVLKLQLKVASGTQIIKKITISSATKKLSGAATVAMTYESGVPAISMATDATANNSVELSLGEGVTLTTTDKAFYIVVPPVAAGEYSVTIETATEGMIKTPPSSTSTNALVRAKITTMPSLNFVGTPLYIENGVNYGLGITIGSTTWAPVNCGYAPYVSESDKGYPYGKLYQWGRKYGQGYDANDATYPSGDNLVTGPVDLIIGQDAANAAKFYMNSDSRRDWLTTKNNNLWNSAWSSTNGDTNPVVTANDPCPTGWRVPTNTELYALIGNTDNKGNWTTKDDQNGKWFDGTTNTDQTSGVFLPACGYRSFDGNTSDRRSKGNYWSSTPTDDNAYYLELLSEYVIMYNSNRSRGFSVRCVKD
jgi:uncharacterized protein (TIGR02145 family)